MTEDTTGSTVGCNESASDGVIADLEQRIVALETGNQYDANKAAIEAIEMKHLQTLSEIRTALLNEQSSNANASTSAQSTTNGDHSVLESLQKENEILKKKMNKLEYRIHHLVSNMELLYEKSASA